jgi:SAM-dependent methyltransferase
MSYETSKCTARRLAQGHLSKLIGNGMDIGAGNDPFRPISGICRLWDNKFSDGDASKLPGVDADSLDYVYSSHCLEHLTDPVAALRRWSDVVKPGGYLYVAVPDYDLYEGGEEIRNRHHKVAFSMNRPTNLSVPLYNVLEILTIELSKVLSTCYVALCDDNYNADLPRHLDQTQRGAVCHIEFMAKKK